MKESRHFYSSLTLLLLLNILIKPIWIFAIDRQVQNVVGTSEYGTYFSLLNFSMVLSFLLDWGVTSYFNRQLASDPQGFEAYAGKFFFIKLCQWVKRHEIHNNLVISRIVSTDEILEKCLSCNWIKSWKWLS